VFQDFGVRPRNYPSDPNFLEIVQDLCGTSKTTIVGCEMAIPSLHWLSAIGEEQIFPLTGKETLIGRKGDTDIVLNNPNVSRHHAKVILSPEGATVIDLESTHGTFLNGTKIERQLLTDGDRIELGKDRVTLTFFKGEGSIRGKSRFDTTEVFEKSLAGLGRLLPSDLSDLEKISCVLDFQYQWEQTYTPDAAFVHILQAALKISGAERAFVLVRQGDDFEYAAGQDGRGRPLSQSEFQTSHSVVNEVANSGNSVFMVEGIQGRFAEQASIVAMNLRAIACLPLKGLRSQEGNPQILGILYLDSRKTMHSLSGLDQKIMSKLAVEAGTVFERVEMIKGIEQRRKLEAELALAEETQRSLLPQRLPDIEGFRIRAFSKPTRYVGGDFYDFVTSHDSAFTGVLADVSGKGVAASLLSSMTLGCVEMQLRAGFELAQALTRVNKFLCERSSTSRFVTMFTFTLDKSGKGIMVNAGHNPAFLFRAATGEIDELVSNNMIVGAFSFASYDASPLQLEKGDSMVIYSDGLTEAENPNGDMLGEACVKEIIRREASAGAQVLEQKLLDAIQTFTKGHAQSDDITLMIIEKT
jgi:serine phosphatase RsbU (regulator of sigma subunit)/pSer/pThr/pTyr-binding forkhead associated (FHA) protein